jgi:hypothetical protein
VPIGLKGNTDGSGAIQIGGSDAISISTGLNTTFAGTITATGTVAGTTGTLYPLVSGTSVSATGTAVDFTGIPSWVKRITVMFQGVSTNGTNPVQVQLGSGSFTTSGYISTGARISGAATSSASSTVGLVVNTAPAVTEIISGNLTITNIGSNSWVASFTGKSSTALVILSGGELSLSGVLDRLRIIGSTTGSPTDTFDAGTINIFYE